jgi:hypothetical protein
MPMMSELDSTLLVDAILRTAAYEDVFDYPLSAGEIYRLLAGVRTRPERVLHVLQEYSPLRFTGGFYTLPGREGLVQLRCQREQEAARLWPQAVRYGRMIARLPFVRMLAVTGSLAMNNVNGKADIDYLLVSTADRLWTCRALALLVVRLAALEGIRLCPNYLVSERALVFQDRTLYTAHELVQMVPLSGMDVYTRLRRLNRWTEYYLPNVTEEAPPVPVQLPIRSRIPSAGRASWLEAGLQSQPGAWFEHWEMDRKIRKLTRQQGDSPEACFSADLCKGHKDRHAEQTEQSFRQRLQMLALEPEL